jgi:hypothetical protein
MADDKRDPALNEKIASDIEEARAFRCDTKHALARLNTAMFAEDDDNEFKSEGVLTTIKKIENHIKVTCGIANTTITLIKGTALAFIGLAGVFSAGKVMGFW